MRARLGFNCPDQPPLGGSTHTLPMGFVPAEPRAVLEVLLPRLSPGSILALQAAHLPNGDVCTAASLFHPDWCPAGPWLIPCHVWGCRECCWQLCLPCLQPLGWDSACQGIPCAGGTLPPGSSDTAQDRKQLNIK